LPAPRFTDNEDGTVTDNLTGLVWLKNADCFGQNDWSSAMTYSNGLASGSCGLSDGSVAGDWRLPNIRELLSLINFGYNGPAVSDTLGTAKWTEGNPFNSIQQFYYWSSSPIRNDPHNPEGDKLFVLFRNGAMHGYDPSFPSHVWPVRDKY